MPIHQDAEAAAAIRSHHDELRDTLQARVGDLVDAVRAGRPYEASEHAVIGYLEDDLLPHAAAEEAALYPAGDSGLTALLVRAMREEHKGIVANVGRLRGTADGLEAVATASTILALFGGSSRMSSASSVPTTDWKRWRLRAPSSPCSRRIYGRRTSCSSRPSWPTRTCRSASC